MTAVAAIMVQLEGDSDAAAAAATVHLTAPARGRKPVREWEEEKDDS